MSDQTEKFESWGLLELFGHQRLAGKLSEQTIGGCHFIRIDVPEVGDTPAYTRLFTQGAIYGMTPMSEAAARKLATYLRAVPVQAYELRSVEPARQLAHDDGGSMGPENPSADLAGVECGDVYEGAVKKVLDFGALVEILPGIEGLLHISQIAHIRVDNVADFLAEGQIVSVKVIETDERGRVKLSMKALLQAPEPEDEDHPF